VQILFERLITGQFIPTTLVSAVHGAEHVVETGKTPVLHGREWRKLLDAMPTDTVRDPRGPGTDRHPQLFFRPHRCRCENESRGSPDEGRRLAALTARKRRQRAHNANPCQCATAAMRLSTSSFLLCPRDRHRYFQEASQIAPRFCLIISLIENPGERERQRLSHLEITPARASQPRPTAKGRLSQGKVPA